MKKMLNREVLARDPTSYQLADGGVAKVAFPPDAEQKVILREQLQTFVCKGAYAEAIRRILDHSTRPPDERATRPPLGFPAFTAPARVCWQRC